MKKAYINVISMAMLLAGMLPAGSLHAFDYSVPDERNNAAFFKTAEVVEWRSLEYAQQQAAKQGKAVLIFVEADWCGICRRMLREVFPVQEVQERIENKFVPVMINVDSRKQVFFNGETYTHREFARSMNVSAVPTLLFVNPDGEVLAHQTGFVSTDRMTALLDYIVSEKFGSHSFEEFLKEMGG